MAGKAKREKPMKKILAKRKWYGLLAFILCVCLMLPAAPIQAASSKSEAIAAYKRFLEGQPSSGSYDFAMIYLDNDSVPELLVGGVNLYTFENGAMVRHSVMFGDAGYGYYKKKGVFIQMHAHFNTFEKNAYETWTYNQFSKSGFTKKLFRDCAYATNSSGKAKGKKKYTYCIYDEKGTETKASKNRFQSALKKMTGKAKMTKIKLYSNTAANRKKYLK